MDAADAIEALEKFTQDDLTATLSSIEGSVVGLTVNKCPSFLSEVAAGPDVLAAAAEVKRIAGQINVTIHALGILLCLPHILEDGEEVEYVSLGAGNTGRRFDLETNYRIAEFKFINWRGGSESIRQNSIFKDFFELAEAETTKSKYLYLLGTDQAFKFFNGGRSLKSVLSKNEATNTHFREVYGETYAIVRDFFSDHKDKVIIQDVSGWLPDLIPPNS